jgi:hypothetical protein
MQTPSDLFKADSSSTADRANIRWLFATNQRNLFYLLAAGMIMPPIAFGNKYYRDTLCNFPGWIPLFADQVPQASIEQSTRERTHLIPCLMEVDLSSLEGEVLAIGVDGKARPVKFPDDIDGSQWVLLIPAPLPVSWVKSIIFASQKEKSSCINDAQNFDNVAIKAFKLATSPRLFTNSFQVAWPPESEEYPNFDRPVDEPLAAGGMMAMLFQMANYGDTGQQACRLAFDAENSIAQTLADPILSPLGDWIRTGKSPDSNDVLQNLFWGAIDELVARHSSATTGSALDVVLEHLESTAGQLDPRLQQALVKLSGDLKNLAGLSDSTITQLFTRHSKSFSRVMTLFFLRQDCEELLDFRHPLLRETDYLAAALLFAARDGWMKLPLTIRDKPGLHDAVVHRMAALAHRRAATGIDLGPPPARPIPLRELFSLGPRGWSKSQREAALFLARNRKWSCIQTRVTLGKGDYQLQVDGKGMHILIDGEAKAVETEVASEQFLATLALERVSNKQESNIRDLLESVCA